MPNEQATRKTDTPPLRDLDVAISFVNDDLPTAEILRARLGASVDVLVYTAKQENLADTDGLQSFRYVLRPRARIVVLLLRPKWGETPRTRVEREASTDRYLNEGPSFLFVVTMNAAPPPPWIPEKLIRLSLKDFGITQAVGAIRARAFEQGNALHAPTMEFLAQRSPQTVSVHGIGVNV